MITLSNYKNFYQHDVVCTIDVSKNQDDPYYVIWRSTDGYIYQDQTRLSEKSQLKVVNEFEACNRCAAQQICITEIRRFGATLYDVDDPAYNAYKEDDRAEKYLEERKELYDL